jgi:hypothetical protein
VTAPPLGCPDCPGLVRESVENGERVYDVYHRSSCPSRRDGGAAAGRWLADQLGERNWLPDYAVCGDVVAARHHLADA